MEKLFDINEEGFSIRSKVFCNDLRYAEKVIILGHGFGGTKDNKTFARFAGQVLSKHKKVAVVAFDWPCHGKDARKKLVLSECEKYLELVVEDCKKRFHTEELYLYATSFGAYLTLKYIAEHGSPFRKIAFRSSAINMYESIVERMLTEEDMNKLSKGKEVIVGYDRKVKINAQFMEELKEADVRKTDYIDFADDIIMIHGTKDEVVPFEPVCQFADNNVIEFIAVEKADHRFKDQNKLDVVSNKIMEFFEL